MVGESTRIARHMRVPHSGLGPRSPSLDQTWGDRGEQGAHLVEVHGLFGRSGGVGET